MKDEVLHQESLLDEAGAEVAEQMRRYRELFDFAPDGYLVTRADGLIEEANRAALLMLGVSPLEVIGKPLVVYVAAPDRRHVFRLLRAAKQELVVHEAEILLQPHGGEPVPVSVHVTAAAAEERAPVRWLLHDITHRRDAARRVSEALHREQHVSARLRDMDSVKNAFLLAVSHDLRGPLTAVVALSRMLAEDSPVSAERRRRVVDSIVANAARIERVQRNLVDLDRLARNALVLQPTSVGLAEVMACSVAAADAADRPVSTHCAVSRAVLDESVVERILDNLLSNAVNHTPAGTPIEVSAEPEGDAVVITVADHGNGVPPALRHLIFEPFAVTALARVDERQRGVGVGLHLVARFAELHGGRAWVEPTRGGGASFRVLLRELT